MKKLPEPTTPHVERAATVASLIRQGLALREHDSVTGEEKFLTDLLEHEFQRVFDDGVAKGSRT